MPADDFVTFEAYEDMLRLPEWSEFEDAMTGKHEPPGVPAQPDGGKRQAQG